MWRFRALLVAVLALTALPACESSGQDEPESRSANASTTVSDEASASPTASRPRRRLDTPPEEFQAMLAPYNTCMREHGALPESAWPRDGQHLTREAFIKRSGKAEEADRICTPLHYPLPPWEKDPANPKSRDFAKDVLACLNDKGITFVKIEDNGIDIGLRGKSVDRPSFLTVVKLKPGCERQAAANLNK